LNVETLAGSSALRCKHFLFERTQKHMDAMYARCPRIGLHYSIVVGYWLGQYFTLTA